MIPEHTRNLLYASGTWRLPGDDTATCEGAKFHSPTPMFTHDVPLIPAEWDAAISAMHSPRAYLCGVCRDKLLILQQILAAHDGKVPWEVRREFGNEVRALALRGWDKYTEVRGKTA